MKKSLFFTAAILSLSISTSVYAINVTGHANATIKATITANETQQMDFGIINAAATGANVVMDTAGTRTTSLTTYGTSLPGIFNVTAEPSTALTITYSASSTLTNAGPLGGTMTLTNITGATVPGSNTTNGGGTLILNAGGTLAVGANQNSGAYTGTYTITLSY